MASIRPNNSKVVRTKIVNINARIPVKTTTPPIYGVREKIEMSISDILKCLTRRAIVHQVLSDGSTIQLTTKNFRDDFEGQLQLKKRMEAKKAKQEEIAVPTGNIDDLNLIDDIDDDEDDNSEEPEEAGNTIITHNFEDGTKLEQVGIEPKFSEPFDDEEIHTKEVTIEEPVVEETIEETPVEEVTESEETETVEPVSEEVKQTYKKSNNSKKSGSKKKK